MGLNPFRPSRDDLSDLGTKCQRENGEGGRVAKVTRSNSSRWKRGVPPIAFELEAVPISRKKSGEGQGGVAKSVENSPGLDEEKEAYLLTRYVIKEAPANVNLERLQVLDYIGPVPYRGAYRFSRPPVKGSSFFIDTIGLILGDDVWYV